MGKDGEALIIDEIKKRIISGKYPAGSKIPSENVLAGRHGITRFQARNAYLRLEEMGFVYSVRGKGRFVAEKKRRILLRLSGEESFTDKIRAEGYSLESRPVFCKLLRYHERIFGLLGAARDEQVFRLGLLRIIDGLPAALHVSYMRERLFDDIGRVGGSIESVFRYFREKGHRTFATDPCLLSVTFPTIAERRFLDCSSLVPLLVLEASTRNAETEEILQFSKILYRSDRFKYVMESE